MKNIRMNRYIALDVLLFLFVISSCDDRNTKTRRSNEIYKIVFATGGCYGSCPVHAFSMDSSLTIQYHGVEFTNHKGFYTGKFSQPLWDSVNVKFERLHYKQLDNYYMGSEDDLSTEIFIYYNGKVKHVRAQFVELPDNVKEVYTWLIDVRKTMTLTKTTDSLTFERTTKIFPLPKATNPSPKVITE